MLLPLTHLERACCRSETPPQGQPLAEGARWLSSPWRAKNLRVESQKGAAEDRVTESALAADPSLDSSRPKGVPAWPGQLTGAAGTARPPQQTQQVPRGRALSLGYPSSRALRGTAPPKAGPRRVAVGGELCGQGPLDL